MSTRVEDYMSTPVVVVSPMDSLAHVRRLMVRYRVGRVVVIDEARRPIGVVTTMDIARFVAGKGVRRSLDSVTVEEVMTANPVVIEYNKPLREAARLMLHHGVSGLPVVDEEGKLVGIITKTDVVRGFAERLRGKLKVSEYMEKDIAVVSPQHSVFYVAELIEQHPSRRVLVVDGGRLVGIIAPSDLAFLAAEPVPMGKDKRIRRFAELPKGRLGPVYVYNMLVAADVMTPEPVTATPDEDLASAASAMLRGGFSSVPVVDSEERPVGIVVKHDILRAVLGKP